MLSINMRIFKTVLLLIAFAGCGVECSPVKMEPAVPEESTTVLSSSVGDHYDQRQNGSENYRVHVDGVAIIIAPMEALLLAGNTSNVPSFNLDDLNTVKPEKPKPEADNEKPQPLSKNMHRSGMRLQDLIIPLLHRLHRQ